MFNAASIDLLFEPFDRTDAPGYAVGIAVEGRTAYRRGFGMASIELPVCLSPTIRMRIGSTTKHFTALSVLLLAEDGLLSIDDSPRRHLPELPEWADGMTVRQLMAHTSGMRDSLDIALHTSGPGRLADPGFHLAYLRRIESVNFAAGTDWSYNNGAYALLAEIVARLSGMQFAEYLHERIFAPLGLTDTMLRPLDTDLVPNSATLHIPAADGGYVRGVFGTALSGEGGIVSTVDDMLTWLRHMDNPVIGSRESWNHIQTLQATNGYGLGLIMGCYRGVRTLQHGGAVVGGSSQMVKLPDQRLDIVILSNGRSSMDGYRLVEAIIDACVSDLGPVSKEADTELVSGRYFSRSTGKMLTLSVLDGRQAVTVSGATLTARRDETGRLSLPFLPTDLRISVVENAQALETTEFAHCDRLVRVDDLPPRDHSALGVFIGTDADLMATVTSTVDTGLQCELAGPLGSMTYRLSHIAVGVWTGVAVGTFPLNIIIEIDAHVLRLSSGRTSRLVLARVI